MASSIPNQIVVFDRSKNKSQVCTVARKGFSSTFPFATLCSENFPLCPCFLCTLSYSARGLRILIFASLQWAWVTWTLLSEYRTKLVPPTRSRGRLKVWYWQGARKSAPDGPALGIRGSQTKFPSGRVSRVWTVWVAKGEGVFVLSLSGGEGQPGWRGLRYCGSLCITSCDRKLGDTTGLESVVAKLWWSEGESKMRIKKRYHGQLVKIINNS